MVLSKNQRAGFRVITVGLDLFRDKRRKPGPLLGGKLLKVLLGKSAGGIRGETVMPGSIDRT